jgi:hypothetical protein
MWWLSAFLEDCLREESCHGIFAPRPARGGQRLPAALQRARLRRQPGSRLSPGRAMARAGRDAGGGSADYL